MQWGRSGPLWLQIRFHSYQCLPVTQCSVASVSTVQIVTAGAPNRTRSTATGSAPRAGRLRASRVHWQCSEAGTGNSQW
jgi:hypothetical protein